MQETDHPQEIERTQEEGREAACEFCEIGENCDFTSPRKRLAEFEVAFTIQSLIFSEINGVAGFLLVSTWAAIRTRYGQRARVGLS